MTGNLLADRALLLLGIWGSWYLGLVVVVLAWGAVKAAREGR